MSCSPPLDIAILQQIPGVFSFSHLTVLQHSYCSMHGNTWLRCMWQEHGRDRSSNQRAELETGGCSITSSAPGEAGGVHLHRRLPALQGSPFYRQKSPFNHCVSSSAPPWVLGKAACFRLEWNETVWALTCFRPPMGPRKGMQLCMCYIYLYIHMLGQCALAAVCLQLLFSTFASGR